MVTQYTLGLPSCIVWLLHFHGYDVLPWLLCCHGYYVFPQRRMKQFMRSMEEQVTNRHHLSLMYRRAKLHEEMTQIMVGRGRWEELDTFTPASSTHGLGEWHNVTTPTRTKQPRTSFKPIKQPTAPHYGSDISPPLQRSSQKAPPPLTIDHMINTGTQSVKVYTCA